MKEKTLAIWILVLLLVIYSATTIAQNQTFNGSGTKFSVLIEDVIQQSRQGNWSQAQTEAEKAIKLWNKGNTLIAIKYAETDYNLLSIYLAELNASVKEKNLLHIERDGVASLYLYNNITSVIPKP